jgi:DNA repair protein RecN (Recombination protein N)
VEAVGYEISDIAGELAKVSPEADPGALEGIRDRLGLLARLRRKYGDTEGEVLDYLATATQRAATLDDDTRGIGTLEAEVADLKNVALSKAAELSARRSSAAARLAGEAEMLLGELAMPGAKLEIGLTETDLYEGGLESVQLLIATGSGEKPKPLSKIASGGELSRIGLALHLLTSTTDAPTMIFDEIDAGVGGEAARAVGAALARLARTTAAQVLVVTHLPQVAAFADWQFRVRRVDGDRRGVSVEAVAGDERVEELSRMLAGLPESERAREHAQELLELAAPGRAP